MTPSKKTKRVKNKFSYVNDVSLRKEDASKNRQRKRKLSDMLGIHWSREELQSFYKAYRKYGKDWKKVAAILNNRSVEMVETIYTLNKAYLSLPEGTASIVGFIAMMTDYYSVQEGSYNEQEIDDGASAPRKLQKSGRGKFRHDNNNGLDSHLADPPSSQSVGLTHDHLSLLEESRSGGTPLRAVGKRTPRIPVSYSYNKNNTKRYYSPSRHGIAKDNDVAQDIALVLTEASQGGGSPQVSETPKRKKENVLSFSVHRGDLTGDRNYLIDAEGVGTVEIQKKGNKFYGKKSEIENNHVGDIKEACSGTEQGSILGVVKGKHKSEVIYANNAESSFKSPRKRSKNILFPADKGPRFDALQALADLSLMMPSGDDTGTEEKRNHVIPGVAMLSDLAWVNPEATDESQLFTPEMKKSKQKSMSFKAADEVKKIAIETKCLLHDAAHSKQDNLLASTVKVPSPNQLNSPTRVRSGRKVGVAPNLKENFINELVRIHIPSIYRALNLKGTFTNCVSSCGVRRWCNFEWFYSAIDYPWFAKREFGEYLSHVGLGHIPRLARAEWDVIRSSLGKPRRFSQQFLTEEKEKLNEYRESVRIHYSKLRAGMRGLPADIARPLSVGQPVMAIHPRTREIHDGTVLTVDHSMCRVQFDQTELGVEFVKDIDCMPSNPWENMPVSLTRDNVAVSQFMDKNGPLGGQKLSGCKQFPPSMNQKTSDDPHLLNQGNSLRANVGPGEILKSLQVTSSRPSILTQTQAKEADVQALSQLTRVLDKKEAVVSELRRMDDEVLENQKDGDHSLKESESFQKQYAALLVLLRQVNDQVSAALVCLRQRNTYQGNVPHMWKKPMSGLSNPIASSNSSDHLECDTQELDSNVVGIVESSRIKARTIVNTAFQAISTMKDGGDGVESIEEVIDHVNNQISITESRVSVVSSTAAAFGHRESNVMMSIRAPDSKLTKTSDKKETQTPSELISHCVSTMLLIQKCTEREFPPAEVARILDSAVTSMQPCCSQNFPVYSEIQKCMGILRSQILALVPS